MNKVQAARLKKLAIHLIAGKQGHKEFDFTCWNRFDKKTKHKNKCGTAGCAIGECPIVFSGEWKFNVFGDPVLKSFARGKKDYGSDTRVGVMRFFGLSDIEFSRLFLPVYEETNRHLLDSATREEVGVNILKFMQEKKVL